MATDILTGNVKQFRLAYFGAQLLSSRVFNLPTEIQIQAQAALVGHLVQPDQYILNIRASLGTLAEQFATGWDHGVIIRSDGQVETR